MFVKSQQKKRQRILPQPSVTHVLRNQSLHRLHIVVAPLQLARSHALVVDANEEGLVVTTRTLHRHT